MTLKPMMSAGPITARSLQEFKIAALHISEQEGTAAEKRFADKWLADVPADVRAAAVAKFVQS